MENKKISIEQNLFRRLVDGVKNCISSDVERSVYHYIQAKVRNGKITLYACDGYRAARASADFVSGDDAIFYIKPFSVPKVKTSEAFAEITIEDNETKVECLTANGTMCMRFKKPADKFIDLDKAFKKADPAVKAKFGINAKYLSSAAKAIGEFSKQIDTHSIIVMNYPKDGKKPFLLRSLQITGENIEQLILPLRTLDGSES